MVKRYQQQITINPQDLSSGAQQHIGTLADRLESFSNTIATSRNIENFAGKLYQKKAIEDANQEVLTKDQKGITQAPKKKDPSFGDWFFTGGVGADTYNAAMKDGYMASLESDLRLQFGDLEFQNQGSLVQYNEKADGLMKGVLEGVDPQVRQPVQQFLDQQVGSARLRIQQKVLTKNRDAANSSRFAAIDSAGIQAATTARQGDMAASAAAIKDAFAVIDGMVETKDLDADKAANIKRDMEREATEQGYRFRLDTVPPEQAIEQLQKMKNTIPKGWLPDEWDLFVQSSEADYLREMAKTQVGKQEDDLETSREISNLKIQAKTGTGTPSEIIKRTEALFNAGLIKEGVRTAIFTSLAESQKETTKDADKLARVNARLGEDGSDTVVSQDDVDFAWNNYLSGQLEDIPPQERNAHIEDFVDKTRLIPTEVKKRISSYLNSDNPELLSEAVDLMDRMQDIRGMPDDLFPSHEKEFAEQAANLAKNMDPSAAIELARTNTDPNNKARIEARKQWLKDKVADKTIDYGKKVDGYFNPVFGDTRITPIDKDRITKEFKDVYEGLYIAGNDNPDDKAAKTIKRNWGVSNAVGSKPRAMKYPVEHFYSINSMDPDDTSYIGQQLLQDVSKENLLPDEIDADNIYLVSDRHTSQTAALKRPEYLVMVVTPSGVYTLADYWKPDREAEVKRRLQQHKDIVEGLREPPPKRTHPAAYIYGYGDEELMK